MKTKGGGARSGVQALETWPLGSGHKREGRATGSRLPAHPWPSLAACRHGKPQSRGQGRQAGSLMNRLLGLRKGGAPRQRSPGRLEAALGWGILSSALLPDPGQWPLEMRVQQPSSWTKSGPGAPPSGLPCVRPRLRPRGSVLGAAYAPRDRGGWPWVQTSMVSTSHGTSHLAPAQG